MPQNQRKKQRKEEQQQATAHNEEESEHSDDVEHNSGGSMDDDNQSVTPSSVTSAPVDSTITPDAASTINEVKQNARHFSKVASQFKFENKKESYLLWTAQFKGELEQFDLLDVISADPDVEVAGESWSERRVAQQKQKSVYHMILNCLPRESLVSLTSSLPSHEHTGYHMWKHLRSFFIGDEHIYLQSLESKFQSIVWEDKESFPSFTARFDVLVNELECAGPSVEKSEPTKKFQLMKAIELSTHKDARGRPVFDRMNTAHKICAGQPYRQWMIALRTEAQEIAEEISGKTGNVKRKREEDSEDDQGQGANTKDVSYVSSSAAASNNNPFNRNQQNQNAQGGPRPQQRRPFITATRFDPRSHKRLCNNWQQSGQCRFGAQCRFSHEQGSNRSFKSNNGAKVASQIIGEGKESNKIAMNSLQPVVAIVHQAPVDLHTTERIIIPIDRVVVKMVKRMQIWCKKPI